MGEAIWLPHLTGARREATSCTRRRIRASSAAEGIEQIRDIEDYVYHYLAYLDVMGWKSIDVVGLSLGGWIAAELAARYPERISKLVLVDAVGIWIREKPIADIFAIDSRHPEKLQQLLFHDVNHPMAKLMAVPRGAGAQNLPEEMVIDFMNALAATAKVGWNPLLHDPRLESLLHRVTAKTLCLWGAHDRVVPRRVRREVREADPRRLARGDPGLRPHAAVREDRGVSRGRDALRGLRSWLSARSGARTRAARGRP